jgi:hypothetical protein
LSRCRGIREWRVKLRNRKRKMRRIWKINRMRKMNRRKRKRKKRLMKIMGKEAVVRKGKEGRVLAGRV